MVFNVFLLNSPHPYSFNYYKQTTKTMTYFKIKSLVHYYVIFQSLAQSIRFGHYDDKSDI